MAFTPTDPTKAEVRVIGTAPNQSLDFYIPRGAKGEPGGLVSGTLLGATNLNDVKTPGLYRQTSSVNATALNNYPRLNNGGVLIVQDMASDYIIQTYEPMTGLSSGPGVMHKRALNGTVWTPWRSFNSTRVDQTAGRVIYQWDDLNYREQLIWGDTGWRQVTVAPIAGHVAGGSVLYRRVNENVYLKLVDVQLEAGSGFAQVITQASIPVGFRMILNERRMQAIGLGNNALDQQFMSSFGDVLWLRTINVGGATVTTRPTTSYLSGTIDWVTNDSWPLTLPGTASGSIPNS